MILAHITGTPLAPFAIITAALLCLFAYGQLMLWTEWPLGRAGLFALGLTAVVAGMLLSDSSLPVHMAAHGLIVAVGAPLIVLARPVTLALRGLRRERARQLVRLLRSRPVRLAIWPPFAFSLFVGAQLLFHLTPLFEASLGDGPLHATEHLLFLTTALLFWSAMLAVEPIGHPWPAAARAALLLAAAPLSDIGGVRLMIAVDPAAGAAMVASMMTLVFAALAVAWASFSREHRRTLQREAIDAAA